MLEHNEKITLKKISIWTMQSIQIWKICSLFFMTYFVFWFFTNSILFMLCHDYFENPTHTFRGKTLCFSSNKNQKLKIKLWWARAHQERVDIYFANFGQVKIDPVWSFYYFGQVTVILLSLVKTYLKDQFKPSLFD